MVDVVQVNRDRRECRSCGGSGACPQCSRGIIFTRNTGNCPDCGGSGNRGYKWVDKGLFSGSEKVEIVCRKCNGSGRCPACGGTMRCGACRGTGWV